MKIRHDWRERLTKLVEGKDWAPIARRGKLNPTYLRDVLERGQTPQLKSAQKLTEAIGVQITDWFLEPVDNSDPKRETPDFQAVSPPRVELMPRNLPVYGSARCGEDGAFEFNTGDPIDFVRRPPRLAGIKDAYALYVVGASMHPWRREGDTVYVHPGQPPKIGDYVVIQIKPPKAGDNPLAYVKLLEKWTDKEIVVSQYNPPERRSFGAGKVVSVHRVVDWSELLGT